jgi:ribonuclease HII
MEKIAVSKIKEILKEITTPDDPRLIEFQKDTRKGVQLAVSQWHRNKDKYLALEKK